MRTSNYLLATQKELPSDAQIISHQLMLRAGMVRKLASGLYSWLPLGLKVLKKIENIVRDEMNKAGALELNMPTIQPREIWQESGRWDNFIPPLLKFKDRHNRDFCYGPTHEEVITDIMRKELRSYKQVPIIFYQIQSKFRDEPRPRSGVMRAREFLMKDAYSFNIDAKSLAQSYDIMYQAYTNIYTRLGLDFRAVLADTGAIGGSTSHEFQILAKNGEDTIAISDESDYAANTEMAEALAPAESKKVATQALKKVSTPNQTSADDVAKFLKAELKQVIKTMVVKGIDDTLVALVVRGDHELNEIKAEKLEQVATPFTLATHQEVLNKLNCKPGYIGPMDLQIPIIVDRSAAVLSDFICGANEEDMHYTGVNWERDLPLAQVADIRVVQEGDPSPDGKGHLKLVRGIEAGHIFQLGDKYSKAMGAKVLDENGREVSLQMGCYGIGVSRLVAATIEQNHDDKGIVWPQAMAPFDIALVPINYRKSHRVRDATDKLYQDLKEKGFDVLLDDRNERPGVMFADMDLLGIPHRLVISERGLDADTIEYKHRQDSEAKNIALEEIDDILN